MKMKNYIALFTVVLSMICTSCEKFLSTEPKDFLTPSQYYKTEEELEFALNGVYDVLGLQGLYYNFLTSHYAAEADEGFMTATSDNAVQLNTYSPSHEFIEDTWKTLYQGISRANYLLTYMENATGVSGERKKQIRGEALFLRSYYYFLLVTYFGGVPITLEPITKTSNNDRAKSSAEEVYELIEKDMIEAESLVLSSKAAGFGGRVNKSAVRGILSRVYLHWAGYPVANTAKYADAALWAKKVIDDTESAHELNPSYKEVFVNYIQDKYDIKESIWEVEFWGNGSQGFFEQAWLSLRMGIRGGNDATGFSYDFFRVTKRLFNKYESFDTRRDWAIAPYYYVGAQAGPKRQVNFTPTEIYERNVGKYRRDYELDPKVRSANSTNYPLLRYADVLLMYAEAENRVNNGPTQDAVNAVNKVRSRAGASTFFLGEFVGEQDFQGFIQDERARELCFEGMRRQDLIRWGIYLDVMRETGKELVLEGGTIKNYATSYQNAQSKHRLFPIPAKELALNRALEQSLEWK